MRMILCATTLAALSAFAATAQSTHQPTVPATAAALPDPAKVYSDNCAACHQEDGKGIEGAFPALAGNAFAIGPIQPPIHVVLEGRAGMPTFKADLTDAQIAAALTHIRTSWGNAASPISAEQVARDRKGEAPDPSDTKVISAH
ncbi:MAG: cytochrome c [Rhizorhabdus sp.]